MLRCLITGLLFLCAQSALAQQPNIVFIFTDDQQYNALAANGNSIIQTSTMDMIAQQGVRFTQARAALPVCSPSRATITTGQFNQTNGVENLGDSVNANSPRLGVELQNAGYATGVTGKWHLGNALDQQALGFDYYATYNSNGSYYRNYRDISDPNAPAKPGNQHIDAYAADRSADFIDQSLSADKPFFLWHNTQTPHLNGNLAWDALPENLAKYDATDFYDAPNNVNNLPGNWDDNLENKPAYYENIRNRTLAQNDNRYLYGDPNELADHTSEYYAVITELDDMLTPLIDKLNTTADPRNPGHMLIDNTYVFFMSDNGWMIGDHGMTSKSLPFDQAARVPFMVMGPGVDTGRTDDRQVSNVDIAPTILDIAGAQIPQAMQGSSIKNLFSDNGNGAGVRNTNIVEIWESTFAGNKPILAGYDGRYEVFYTYDDESDELPAYVEIYDTQNDIWELNNLAATVGQDRNAYQAFRAVHQDIQAHRVNNLGIASHALKTVANGETFQLRSMPNTPTAIANQTLPQIIAADIESQTGSKVEGVGVILGNLTARSGSTINVASEFVSVSGPVVANFNDLDLGVVTGQDGGTGWSSSYTEENAGSGGTINVVSGDLVAPASTNYGLTQDGDGQHLARLSGGASSVERSIQTDLNGDVWFSFLAQVDAGGRAGINIDGHGNIFDNRFLLRDQGATLDFFVDGNPNDLSNFSPSTASTNDVQLIVGKLSLATGNDTLEWWVNPDVSLGEAGLSSSADMSYLLNDRDFDEDDGTAGIQLWSLHVYSGGHIDNLVLSDEADGFLDVTTRITFDGSVVTEQLVSPAFILVAGDYLHEVGAALELDIYSDANSDKLEVQGDVTLDGGSLTISLSQSFTPEAGDSFDLLDFATVTGSFDSVQLPALSAGLTWNTSELLTTGEISVTLMGDFNNDGSVDAADYTIWRDELGQTGITLAADANLDGVVDQDDYNLWSANYGTQIQASASVAIPEPTSALMLVTALACLAGNLR